MWNWKVFAFSNSVSYASVISFDNFGEERERENFIRHNMNSNIMVSSQAMVCNVTADNVTNLHGAQNQPMSTFNTL